MAREVDVMFRINVQQGTTGIDCVVPKYDSFLNSQGGNEHLLCVLADDSAVLILYSHAIEAMCGGMRE